MMTAEEHAWSVLRSDNVTVQGIAGAIRAYREENNPPAFTLEQWCAITGVQILDPDGFDRKDPNLHTRLFTLGEFADGLIKCTVANCIAVARFYSQIRKVGLLPV